MNMNMSISMSMSMSMSMNMSMSINMKMPCHGVSDWEPWPDNKQKENINTFGKYEKITEICANPNKRWLLPFCTNSSIFNIAVIPPADVIFLLVTATTIFRIYNIGSYISMNTKL